MTQQTSVDGRAPAEDWAAEAAAALRAIARDESAKAYLLARPELYAPLLRAARRYIAGESIDQCLRAVHALNARGIAATVDAMGESTRERSAVIAATQRFRTVLERLAAERLRASISLDLSHIGLAIAEQLAAENTQELAILATETGCELMISMEGSERTSAILNVYADVVRRSPAVGVTVQAYLERSENDLSRLLDLPGKIRLVKGAYAEPASIALRRGSELDDRYCHFVERVVRAGHSCSLATHDATVIARTKEIVGAPRRQRQVEFEMLYGVQEELLEELRACGYPVRVFLPYGTEWYLYLCHRLAENPPSLLRAVADAVGDLAGRRDHAP